MKRSITSLWNLLVTLSLIYYAGFFVLMLLGVFDLTNTVLPSKDVHNAVREIFSFGLILFWIYLVAVPLGLTGILRIPKKNFVAMVAMVSVTIILFILSEVG